MRDFTVSNLLYTTRTKITRVKFNIFLCTFRQQTQNLSEYCQKEMNSFVFCIENQIFLVYYEKNLW